MRRGNRWIIPAVVLGIVVLCTVAFTLHGMSDRRVADVPATASTPFSSATGVAHTAQALIPSRTPVPAATSPVAPSSTAVPIATSTEAPPTAVIPAATSTIALAATSMPRPATAIASATAVAPIPPTVADAPLTTAAILLARLQLGYVPVATDPTVQAFAQELTVLEPICNVGMMPLAYQIANVGAAQGGGARFTLLTTLSRLTKLAEHGRKHGDTARSCANLFAAYAAQAQVDNQGGKGHGKGSDNGNQD